MFTSRYVTGLLIGSAVGIAAAVLYLPRPRRRSELADEGGSARPERLVDEEVEQSFPASDPPSWTPATSSITSPSGY